jgi:DNA polymerase III subunit delta'
MSYTTKAVLGHNDSFEQFLHARGSGRLHHAWLFDGPKGIGKAQTAYNLAAIMLGADYQSENGCLSVDAGPVTDHMNAGSHPDFRVLSISDEETSRSRTGIPVEDVRRLSAFFSLKPALGGYRVAIVDAMDDLNRNGANALLKTLEEPPKNCLLFLIFHRTTLLLPTIRSRCQRLKFDPLSGDQLRTALGTSSADPVQDAVLPYCNGSPGLARAYLEADVGSLLTLLETTFDKDWLGLKPGALNKILQDVMRSEIHFEFCLRFLDRRFLSLAETLPVQASSKLSQSWARIRSESGIRAGYKLDLAARSAKCLAELQELSRRLERSDAV